MDHQQTSTLADLPTGVEAEVTAIQGDEPFISRRLMVMGIVPGEKVRIIKAAPLGDPLEIRVSDLNNSLMVRRTEAKSVLVHSER
jgi:Fe2+ transport system protein FeoA